MGMRIRKSLCYFAENVEFDDAKLFDWCDNTTPEQLKKLVEKDDFWKDIENGKDLSNLDLKCRSANHEKFFNDFCSNFVHDWEMFGEGFLGAIPFITEETWTRHNDDIDYEEFYLKYPNHEENHHIQYLNKSLYPYEGWMDKNTGKSVPYRSDIMSIVKFMLNKPDGVSEVLNYNKTIELQTGYKTFEEMRDNTIPYVPLDIYMMMHYSQAFTDPWKTYLSLRPAIVEWFS